VTNEQEIARLAAAYGEPLRAHHDLEIGPSLFYTRFTKHNERRGEVVFALEQPDGRILLHRKTHYRPGIYRLLSGGVNPDEAVIDALHREAGEETGLPIDIVQFIAALDYQFHMGPLKLPFVSWLFHVRQTDTTGRLSPDWNEIEDIIAVWPTELPGYAARLRTIPGPRADWGRWRAIAHDIIADALNDNR